MQVTWLGHSTFLLEVDGQKNILIDPWVNGNPAFPPGFAMPKVDAILVSHGHGDHTGDLIPLAKEHNATVVCNYEIYLWLESKGIHTASPMNKGGSQMLGDVRVTMTHAFHSSSMQDGDSIIYGGEAAGFVITTPSSRSLYFAGDTALFGDMALIARLYAPHTAMLPIGDLFTMGPDEAAVAAELLGVKRVIPMHYGTFPPLTGTPDALRTALKGKDVEVLAPQAGKPFAL